MTRTLMFVAFLALPVDHGHCQDLAKAPAFEVASITPCKPGTLEPPGRDPAMVRYIYPGGRFDEQVTTLKFLFEWAYGIIPEQHSSGPSWMEKELYDIVAKAAGNATEPEMKLMLRTLLAERFKLKFHVEKREMSIIAVSQGTTEAKLFPPKEGETHGIRVTPQTGPDQKLVSWHVVATRYSLEQLNESFARQLGRVIVDNTGLKGDFDFTLEFTQDEDRPNPLDPANVIKAMRDQLGLTVKSQKGLADFFVIDNAERVLAGN